MADDDRARLKEESPATQEIVRLTDEVARLKRAQCDCDFEHGEQSPECPIHEILCVTIAALRATQAELVEALRAHLAWSIAEQVGYKHEGMTTHRLNVSLCSYSEQLTNRALGLSSGPIAPMRHAIRLGGEGFDEDDEDCMAAHVEHVLSFPIEQEEDSS